MRFTNLYYHSAHRDVDLIIIQLIFAFIDWTGNLYSQYIILIKVPTISLSSVDSIQNLYADQ